MLKKRVREKPKQARIALTITSNRYCSNISKVMLLKNWNLLAINQSLIEIFNCEPITAFTQIKNLNELIRSNKIEKKKVEKKKVKKRQIQKQKSGKYSPCLTNIKSLCCEQVRKATTSTNQKHVYIRYSKTAIVPTVIYIVDGVNFV